MCLKTRAVPKLQPARKSFQGNLPGRQEPPDRSQRLARFVGGVTVAQNAGFQPTRRDPFGGRGAGIALSARAGLLARDFDLAGPFPLGGEFSALRGAEGCS